MTILLTTACGQKDTGNLKITLQLPYDVVNSSDCSKYTGYGFIDDFCIVPGDTIEFSIFSTESLAVPYTLDSTQTFRVTSTAGEEEFARSLRTNRYYKFFVKVTNRNEKVKLSGGTEGVYYQEDKNYTIAVFLGLAGDFVRIVKDHTANQASKTLANNSLVTYLPEEAPSGAAAIALKDGRIFLAGGSHYTAGGETFEKKTNLIDMSSLKVSNGPDLREAVKDHTMAFLDMVNAPEGRVVIAFGKTQNGYSDKIYFFNPVADAIETKNSFSGRALARSLTINGEVYISGGCNSDTAFTDIIKVDRTGIISKWRDMSRGRCLHSMIDVSWTDSQGNLHPAILVFGGAKKYITDPSDHDLVGYDDNNADFAEIVDENGSHKIALENAGCQKEPDGRSICFTLAGQGAARVKWDNENKGPANDIVVVTAGGFLQAKNDQDLTMSPYSFVVLGKNNGSPNPVEMSWKVLSYGSSIRCAYTSMVPISSPENYAAQYAAINCGNGETVRRAHNYRAMQQMFVMEVRASAESEDGNTTFGLTASVRNSITNSTTDDNNYGTLLDGPAAVNSLGQAFLFGPQFVYLVSGYSYRLF